MPAGAYRSGEDLRSADPSSALASASPPPGVERRPERLMRGKVDPAGVVVAADASSFAGGATRPLPARRRSTNSGIEYVDGIGGVGVDVSGMTRPQHLDPNSAALAGGSTRSHRHKLDAMMRNDSLSSDPSDCARPSPPKPHKHRSSSSSNRRQSSMSSSDDGVQTTPDGTSCEEQEIESESISEKGQSA